MRLKLITGILLIISSLIFAAPVKAEDVQPEMIKGHATAYCLDGTMANGTHVREGACASSADRLGAVLMIYKRLPDDSIGDFIGMYEVLDAGGTDGIKSGKVIDIWKPTYEKCQEFMNLVYEDGCHGNVWIQVVHGAG